MHIFRFFLKRLKHYLQFRLDGRYFPIHWRRYEKCYWVLTEMCLLFSNFQWDWKVNERFQNSDFSELTGGHSVTFLITCRHAWNDPAFASRSWFSITTGASTVLVCLILLLFSPSLPKHARIFASLHTFLKNGSF